MIIDGYTTLGSERDTNLSVVDLLRQMDEAGIQKALICPEDRELAVFNLAGNERILQHARQYHDRLIPACGVNPWYGRDAQSELNRCVERGARVLIIAPALQGFIPSDEVADELLMRAGQLQIPVYIHTGPHGSGSPAQVALVAEKHPLTNFILGHCGSTDHARDMLVILADHRLENLWYELSFVRPWAAANYIEIAGSSRFIWGSCVPRNVPKFELEQLRQYLSLEDYPDVYGANLKKLLDEGAT
jgi:predicted TIM-barrel fold metal-dependent hydrolase